MFERDDGVPRPLTELLPGCRARLHADDLEPAEAGLLRAMGLVNGSPLVVRVNGDPCIVEVRATRIGLGRAVARRLQVVLEPPGPLP